jgi:hypothetical protein
MQELAPWKALSLLTMIWAMGFPLCVWAVSRREPFEHEPLSEARAAFWIMTAEQLALAACSFASVSLVLIEMQVGETRGDVGTETPTHRCESRLATPTEDPTPANKQRHRRPDRGQIGPTRVDPTADKENATNPRCLILSQSHSSPSDRGHTEDTDSDSESDIMDLSRFARWQKAQQKKKSLANKQRSQWVQRCLARQAEALEQMMLQTESRGYICG